MRREAVGAVGMVGMAIGLAAAVAMASEQSTLLSSRGLVDFHAGRFKEALERFDRAVAEDPADAYARYYRAVTRARLDDSQGAIDDLQQVLTIKPDLDEAALELGVALVQASRYEEAIPRLQQAQRTPDSEARASLFLGVALLRLERFDEARTNLERASTRDVQLTPTVRYYGGVADFAQHRLDSAERNFRYVIDARPDSQIATESKGFLEQIRKRRAQVFDFFGAAGFQYDSNVVLAPSANVGAQALGISNQSDGRATIDVGGTCLLGRTDTRQLLVGYSFYQSLHFELTHFNLQVHHAHLEVDSDAGPFKVGVLGAYEYNFLETSSFLREARLNPVISLPEGDFGRTDAAFQLRRRDYLQPQYHILDAYNYAPSITQLFYFGPHERFVRLGYQWEREDTGAGADAQQFAYDANQVGIAFGWTFPAAIEAEIGYDWRHEEYAQPSHGRRDHRHIVTFVARRPITEYLTISAGYFGVWNDSNSQTPLQGGSGTQQVDLYTYERQIGALVLEVRF